MTLGRDDASAGVPGSGGSQLVGQRMVLDATALSAIEVVETLEGVVASRRNVAFLWRFGGRVGVGRLKNITISPLIFFQR